MNSLGQPLCPRTFWNDSNQSTFSLVTLPCPFLPRETTTKAPCFPSNLCPSCLALVRWCAPFFGDLWVKQTIFLMASSLDLLASPDINYNLYFKNMWDFPGGPVVKNPPAKAGDIGSIPTPGSPHAGEQLSPCSRVREPQLMSPWATTTEARMPRACSLQGEKPMHQN